jgi:prepilin-type N-terminal cleavage/methylation domain-containing protein
MRTTRGFTLLELIVAMGIMVLVAATLTSTITSAFSLKRSAENAVDATRDTEIVGDVFVSELANALQPSPYSVDLTVSTTSTIAADAEIPWYLAGPFQGDQNVVRFYTSGTESRGDIQGDVRYIEFGLTAQKDGTNALVRRQRMNLLMLPEELPDEGIVEEILVQSVDSLEFQYHDGTGWQPSWDTATNENRLPYAVSMTLTLTPLRPDGPPRIIKRSASVILGPASNAAADVAAEAALNAEGGG